MNITCECVGMRTSVGNHHTIRLQLEGVVLDGTTDTKEVLNQLDGAVVIEWLAEQGYVITHQEKAA
ncbi:TPA: thioredoxin reductase [Kluyvera ascorbata]|uniref:thioredoxin reductase n=1 Tax=Kluyvera ascorbata TaxID=51288 RepID=UPI00290EDF57|nr:thioredoxin reductase [Kluyvera ascorbata]MDU3912062.1 thioredoxin reductase [Kluyvera ascorbata]HDG1721668.1 thioredoxin reductase [Kluyvera ascorbata]